MALGCAKPETSKALRSSTQMDHPPWQLYTMLGSPGPATAWGFGLWALRSPKMPLGNDFGMFPSGKGRNILKAPTSSTQWLETTSSLLSLIIIPVSVAAGKHTFCKSRLYEDICSCEAISVVTGPCYYNFISAGAVELRNGVERAVLGVSFERRVLTSVILSRPITTSMIRTPTCTFLLWTF